MSASSNVTVWCDACGVSDTAPSYWTAAKLRKQLRERGWRTGVHDPDRPGERLDFCASHDASIRKKDVPMTI